MLSKFPVNLYLLPDLSVSAYSPVIGDPERQPVKPLPAAAAEVAEVPAVELVPGVVWLPGAWFGGAEFVTGVLVSSELGGLAGALGGVVVFGLDVCEFAPVGLLCVCAGAELEGLVLPRLVLWATTQLADSSNKENRVALAFMRVSRLRCGCFT